MIESATMVARQPDVGAIMKEITGVMASLDDSQRVLDALVSLVTRMLRVDRCSLMLIDPQSRELRIRAAVGVPADVMATYRGRLGEGISGWVAMEGEPLLITDVENHPLFKRSSRRGYSTTSLLSVPLIFREGVIGVLNVNNKRNGELLTENDELWLSTVANFIVISLEKARMREIEAEKKRIDADLNMAQEIQKSFLPHGLPDDDVFEYAARCVSAYEVAGDFYDVIPLQDGTVCLVLGDVCGKGVTSALYMARVISYFRAVASLQRTADGLLDGVNRFLADEWTDRAMVTACMLVVDLARGRVRLYNAGHMPPYHMSGSTGELRAIEFNHGFPLGVDGSVPYEWAEFDMAPGDLVMMYTDGMSEAVNPRGDLFGFAPIEAILRAHRGAPLDLINSIARAVQDFAAGLRRKDDETILVVRKR